MKKATTQALSSKELSIICFQFYTILKAGIPLDTGVSAIKDSLDDKKLKAIIENLEKQVAESEYFYIALEKCSCFPDYMVTMISIGEQSGNMDSVCLSLSKYYERESNMKENIRTAVTYPVILIAMITVVMAVLVIKVLPALSKVIENLGGDLSSGSRNAIVAGRIVGNAAFYVVIAIAVIAFIAFLMWGTKGGKKVVTSIFTKVPAIRKTLDKIGASRFTSVFSMLLSSGFDTSQALELLPKILPTEKISAKAELCKNEVENGEDLSDALNHTGFFKGLYPSMIKIGRTTGTLDVVMKNISESCEEDSKQSLTNLTASIEPIMIGFLSVVIGCVLLSNLLPLLGIISSVG